MTRDMDLIRDILRWLESLPTPYASSNPDFPGRSPAEIAYHAHLLWDAGLVDALDIHSSSLPAPAAMVRSLTWTGHEFLDAARNDTTWQQARRDIIKAGKSFTLDLLKEALVAAARSHLGL